MEAVANNSKLEKKLSAIHVSSAFKIMLCFITFVGIFYCIYVERDLMKALFLLNIIANYRIMLAFLTDWHEEIIFKTPNLINDAHGIVSERKIPTKENKDGPGVGVGVGEGEKVKVSNFISTSIIDNNKYGYLNNIYDDKVNYNFQASETNFAWWSEH